MRKSACVSSWLPRVPLVVLFIAAMPSASSPPSPGTLPEQAPPEAPCLPVSDTDSPLSQTCPPSTLLAPGTTELQLTVVTSTPTSCSYNLGESLPFTEMAPFAGGAGATQHTALVSGLDPDPAIVNQVYIRCASDPELRHRLVYRCRGEVSPGFPRTGNLWGYWGFLAQGAPSMARIDLWLGVELEPAVIRELRDLNPEVLVLTSINAVEHAGLPEDYYLHDVDGKRIEVWPGAHRLNLTKPEVAAYQAHYAYQLMLEADLLYDGCFFDNVMTSQSWLTRDIYGNPFLVDADEDGVEDDPQVFDAAWKAGVFAELEEFRRLLPEAILSGHAMSITEPGIGELFNGISFGFVTAETIEGTRSFRSLWELYRAWETQARAPVVIMFESSPPDQIAYGYDFAPWSKIPPSTLEFARTLYPSMRFGLAFTLMGDAYFAHEFGDTWHGNDWWYDELDFDLGQPLGPAEEVVVEQASDVNLVEDGSFEESAMASWDLWVSSETGCVAELTPEATDVVQGSAAAHVNITATSGVDWHIDLAQRDRTLVNGQEYELRFWAKASISRAISLSAQKGSPDWRNYGLWQTIAIDTQWQEYAVRFEATEDTSESRVQFLLGSTIGDVWLDDVRLVEQPPFVLTREFTHGLVLLNGTREEQEIEVGEGYRRLEGAQAPRLDRIVDDGSEAFSASGPWSEVMLDSGEWQAAGPYYHDWGSGCHRSEGAGVARWQLPIDEQDTYTLTVWWPAAPEADGWTRQATFEVVVAGQVVTRTVLSQRAGGDEWHQVASVNLAPGDEPVLQLSSGDSLPCVADAIHVRSAARYNDGSPASSVVLQPMDGIILRRVNPAPRLAVERRR